MLLFVQQLKSDCQICPSGYYCRPGTSDAIQFQCKLGHYCHAGTTPSTQQPCPNGKYAPVSGLKSELECWMCPGGFVCDDTGLKAPNKPCPSRQYCEPYTLTSGKQCPEGSVCPQGTAYPRPCPPGKLQDGDECVACHSGQACSLYGQNKAKYDKCLAGHFCERGADTPIYKVAPPGTYARTGADKAQLCDPGTYNSFAGQSEVSACS